jgi:glycine hydroxymethyltransferase
LTSRGFSEKDFSEVAGLVQEAVNIVLLAKSKLVSTKLKDFQALCLQDSEIREQISTLKKKVNDFALSYPMPGFDDH